MASRNVKHVRMTIIDSDDDTTESVTAPVFVPTNRGIPLHLARVAAQKRSAPVGPHVEHGATNDRDTDDVIMNDSVSTSGMPRHSDGRLRRRNNDGSVTATVSLVRELDATTATSLDAAPCSARRQLLLEEPVTGKRTLRAKAFVDQFSMLGDDDGTVDCSRLANETTAKAVVTPMCIDEKQLCPPTESSDDAMTLSTQPDDYPSFSAVCASSKEGSTLTTSQGATAAATAVCPPGETASEAHPIVANPYKKSRLTNVSTPPSIATKKLKCATHPRDTMSVPIQLSSHTNCETPMRLDDKTGSLLNNDDSETRVVATLQPSRYPPSVITVPSTRSGGESDVDSMFTNIADPIPRSFFTDRLGRLRSIEGVSFAWIGDVISVNHELGRHYFSGFVLDGRTFKVGDSLRGRFDYEKMPAQTRILVSAFQAAKSFVDKETHKIEHQKRGHPYMELQNPKSKKLFSPTWALTRDMRLVRNRSASINPAMLRPAISWNVKASEVHFCNNPKVRNYERGDGIEWQMYDGSGDESSNESLYVPVRDDDTDSENSADDDDFVLQRRQNGTMKSLPLQLVTHDTTKLETFFLPRIPCSNLDTPELDGNVALFLRRNKQDEETIERIKENARKQKIEEEKLNFIEFDLIECDKDPFDDTLDAVLHNCRQKVFGKMEFRPLQYQVCHEIVKGRFSPGKNIRNDVFFIAPCGYGKTLCFVLTSQILKGITLVIEPLRALISSLECALRQKGLAVEALHTHKDAMARKGSAAYTRLVQLAEAKDRNPLIVLSTPELIARDDVLSVIRKLVGAGQISQIVIDEFDFIDKSTPQFRPVYRDLVFKLKDATSKQIGMQIPFLYLSATGTRSLMNEILPKPHIGSKPVICLTEDALPSTHVYRVEPKVSKSQIVDRMVEILNQFTLQDDDGISNRCICYCLTPTCCREIDSLFRERGIDSDVFSGESDESKNKHGEVLEKFHSGKLQVICATSALGRGVHLECPIRFIFHCKLPLSISDYIQETGRGGRDGKICHCVLFLRLQDYHSALKVAKGGVPVETSLAHHYKVSNELDNVCKYAMEGRKCRKEMLAYNSVNVSGRRRKSLLCHKSALCDNCKTCGISAMLNITAYVADFLHALKEGLQVVPFKAGDIPGCWPFHSLVAETLRRYLRADSKEKVLNWLARITEAKNLTFQLRNCSLELIQQFGRPVSPKLPTTIATVATEAPFLIQFEAQRLDFNLDGFDLPSDPVEAFKELYYRQKKPHQALFDLESISTGREIPSLFYSAQLLSNGDFKLFAPEKAYDRRIYRKFGSDRFLHVSIHETSSADAKRLLQKIFDSVQIGGRRFSFFWCKKDKNPQSFVLFAEKGCGIAKIDECSAEDARSWCIPLSCNPQLSIGQFFKRMKLCFSSTRVGCVLPSGTVQILCEEVDEGIDGAGLISREAIDSVWLGYNGDNSNIDKICPYSGFQGRLAGMKGVWILDSTLHGFVVQCRKSQIKYNVPMKCLDPEIDVVDEQYETMEVCSFCKASDTRLNSRLIQILEHHAMECGKVESLNTLIKGCVDKSLDLCPEKFVQKVTAIAKKVLAKEPNELTSKTDTEMMTKMFLAGVRLDDPEYCRRQTRLMKKELESMRDKANYKMEQCCYLVMFPDHTNLLQQEEAFLPLALMEKRLKSGSQKEVLVMRSPSYFPTDLRRLKLVSLEELQSRGTGSNRALFFESIVDALVLNTPEARNMSGGDYDGDQAWVCTNIPLLECLPSHVKARGLEMSHWTTKPSSLEKLPWEDSRWKSDIIIEYMYHFRHHMKLLGQLSEDLDRLIDKLSFNDERSADCGKAAFLQVDMPFFRYELLTTSMQTSLGKLWPHWKSRGESCSYHSDKLLGKLFDAATDQLNKLNFSTPNNESKIKVQKSLEGKDEDVLVSMEEWAKDSIQRYMNERAENLRKSSGQRDHFCWKDEYFKNIRATNTDQKDMRAAILYIQCYSREQKDSSSHACELVWGVFKVELLNIFSGGRSEYMCSEVAKNFF